MMHRNLDRRVEVLVQLPGEAEIADVGALLDLAFDPEHQCLGAGQRRPVVPHRGITVTSRRPASSGSAPVAADHAGARSCGVFTATP